MPHYTTLLFASLSCEAAVLSKGIDFFFFHFRNEYNEKVIFVFHVALKCKMSDGQMDAGAGSDI